uniref:OBG-type G domain-containing protein n=2 Tax=Manihot esculenta TaxID=3983 RepID=A0A2C9WPB3_MANES
MRLRCAKSFCHIDALRKSSKSPWIYLSLFSCSDATHTKAKCAPLQETRMRDRFTLHAKGGDGGKGCSSFRRSGRGGDVILECSPAIWDLSGLHHHVNAARGGNGASKSMIGTRGEDKVVQVPIGTVIHLLKGELPSTVQNCSKTDLDPWELPGTLHTDQSESHWQSVSKSTNMEKEAEPSDISGGSLTQAKGTSEEFASIQAIQREPAGVEHIHYDVAELTKLGQQIIVARGGEGGLGNVSSPDVSKKANEDQSCLSIGLPGSEAVLLLELKSIADVGLVGMPNAGKSTLLGALSRAKPRVGHYAFTTLRPNLGKLNFDDFSITVADIPGLIKGAHENRGLGHAFLRHIERTKVLAYVLDLAAGLDGRKGFPPWEQLKDLVLELEHHQEGLSDRPSLVVANKIDEAGADEVYEELKRRVQDVPIYPVCAVLEEGVPELKAGLRMLMDSVKLQRLGLVKIDCS